MKTNYEINNNQIHKSINSMQRIGTLFVKKSVYDCRQTGVVYCGEVDDNFEKIYDMLTILTNHVTKLNEQLTILENKIQQIEKGK